MNSIITVLIAYNQILLSQIHKLLVSIAKNIPLNPSKYGITSPKYNQYFVDKLPVLKYFKPLNYRKLLNEHQKSHGKELKLVRHGGPRCGAPYTFLRQY